MSKTTRRLPPRAGGPGPTGTAPGGEPPPVARPAQAPAAASPARELIRAADPTELKGSLEGDHLRLTWDWPADPRIQMCLVMWRPDRYPESPEERDTPNLRLARRSYEAQGCALLSVSPSLTDIYARVYAALLDDSVKGFETWLYSPGSAASSRAAAHRHAAVVANLIQRRGHAPVYEISTVDGSPLPRLIVRRDKGLPLRAAEGVEVARYSGGASTWSLVLAEAEDWPSRSWITVFSSTDGLFWRSERCAKRL